MNSTQTNGKKNIRPDDTGVLGRRQGKHLLLHKDSSRHANHLVSGGQNIEDTPCKGTTSAF